MRKKILAVFVCRDRICAALVNEKLRVEAFETLCEEQPSFTNDVQCVVQFINRYLQIGGRARHVAAVAVGIPGSVDRARRRILACPDLLAGENVALADILEKTLDVPVYVNRCANFRLLYDMRKEKIEPRETVLGFYFDQWCGCAISIDGMLLLGKNGCAGEFGTGTIWNGRWNAAVLLNHLRMRKDETSQETSQMIDQLLCPVIHTAQLLDADHVFLSGAELFEEDFLWERLKDRFFQKMEYKSLMRPLSLHRTETMTESVLCGGALYAYRCLQNPFYR